MLTASGGFGIGLAALLVARTLIRSSAVVLAMVAGASLLISMPMAVIYATGTLVGSTWLDLDVMARVHGTLNAHGFALPVMVAWTLDRRARDPAPANLRPARDPRRLGLGAAAIIAGYALVVAAISAAVTADEFGPPQAVPRPLLLAALLMLPAAVAAIGAIRRSRPMLLAAGALCLAQSFIAFSGVTIPFVVPAFLLLAIGIQGSGLEHPRLGLVGGLFVVGLGIAAWVSLFALTETTCWIARTGADGSVIHAEVPATEMTTGNTSSVTLGPGELAAGCDGATLTVQGAGLAAVFGIGTLALAALASMPPPATRAAREKFA